jgi:hypothetical protein
VVARQRRAEFTSVKAHSGILLNVCADQLEARVVGGSSYGPEIAIRRNELRSEEECVMADEDVTQWEKWCDPEHIQTSAVQAINVELAAEEQ